jgi:DNA-nicking Smr family endonuclease
VLDSALNPGELSALNAAYRGVEPIKRKQPGRVRRAAAPPPRASLVDPEEQAARERLAALVGGGVRFDVRWDDGLVQGVRRGVAEKQLRRLSGAGFEPEATLDLHGMRREQAQRAVQDFVRESQRRGARYLLVIVGKGLHSDDGRGVLAEVLVEALTRGLAAPKVAAFATAAERHGGRGAIAVELH